MSPYLAILDLAGYVALLLWGVHMVQTGIQRTFGPNLRTVLGVALSNRLNAFLAGVGVTAILQSSTATGLIVAGFAANGLVGLVPALAAMLGANVGTTLIVQVLSFDIAALAPALILLGVVMFRRHAGRTRDLSRVFIGLGLLLLSLHQLLGVLEPYRELPTLRIGLQALSGQPALAVLIAAILAWAAHSSVAVVVLVMSFSAQGILPLETAFALVLGANLGTAINPLMEGSARSDPRARRLPLGNFINRAAGVLLALAILHLIHPWMNELAQDNARAVANFHTLFNLVLAAAFLPLLGPYAAMLRRWLPANVDQYDPGLPIYLDSAAREVPVVALGNAEREALRMADALQTMLTHTRAAFATGDRKRIAEARQEDNTLDRLNAAIKAYVAGLDQDELTADDRRRSTEILTFIINIEHAGDVIDQNLLGHISKLSKRGLTFSPEGHLELDGMFARLDANLRLAASLFMTEDARAARLLAAEKDTLRKMEVDATQAHFDRLRSGRIDTMETSALHLDMLRDLRRVNTHLVAAAAYPVLESRGELLATRLGPKKSGRVTPLISDD